MVYGVNILITYFNIKKKKLKSQMQLKKEYYKSNEGSETFPKKYIVS
jgi:hypothetical protein